MKFSASIPLFLAALSSAAPVEDTISDGEPQTPPLDTIKVKDIKYNGSGCPQGSVASTFSDSGNIFTLIFNSYEANIGPNVAKRSDARKNCQLNLKLLYPPGFTFSVAGFITRGYADIDAGVTAEVGSIYYFSGQSQQTSSRNTIQGPWHGSYTKEDNIKVGTAVWSPCGVEGAANINTDIRLVSQDSSKAGSLTVDSIDGKFQTQISYKLDWRTCGGRRTRSANDAPPADAPPSYQDLTVADNTLVLSL